MAQIAIGIGVTVALTVLQVLLTPQPKSSQSKIDQKPPQAEFGTAMWLVFGKVKVENCPMTWAIKLKRKTVRTGRKGLGQGGSRTYKYYMTARFDICLEITEINKVWYNGNTVYRSDDESNPRSERFLDSHEMFIGTDTQGISNIIDDIEEDDISAHRGIAHIVSDEYPTQEFKTDGFPKVDVKVIGLLGLSPKVKDIITILWERSGLDSANLDVTKIPDSYTVKGCYCKNDGDAYAELIEKLMQLFFLISVDLGQVTIFKPISITDFIVNLPIGQFGAKQNDNSVAPPYKRKGRNPLEVPSEVELKFQNPDDDNKQGMVSFRDATRNYSNQLTIDTGVVQESGKMSEAANKILYQTWIQSVEFTEIILMPAYDDLMPGDLVQIPNRENNTIELAQISKKNFGQNYLVEIEAKRYSAKISEDGLIPYNFDVTYDDLPYGTEDDLEGVSTASVIPLDISLLNNGDIDQGIYIAVKGGTDWDIGYLYSSLDGGATWTQVAELLDTSITGKVTNVISSVYHSGLIDRITEIYVEIEHGSGLSPVTTQQFLRGQYYGLFGNEIIAFRDVTLVTSVPLVYKLKYLIRGVKGTEQAINNHVINEQFVLLTGYLERVSSVNIPANTTVLFKALPILEPETTVADTATLVVKGEAIKPYIPAPILAKRIGIDWQISWYRRTRKNGGLSDYVDIPYADGELASYIIQIFNSSNVLVKTITTNSTNYLYTQSEQIADFGVTQSTLRIKIFQNTSFAVDRRAQNVLVFS